MNAFDLIWEYREAFFRGLWVTAQLCLLIWPLGIVAGTALGVLGHRSPRIGTILRIISFLLMGIPILVLLFWLHYPAQTLLGVRWNPFVTAVITIGLVNVFAVSDTVRASLERFPKEHLESAAVLGLSRQETILRIGVPIVLRQSFPTILLIQVTMLQATLFASLISVDEVFRAAQRLNASIYRPVEIYSALALLFLLICLPLNGIAIWLHRRYRFQLSA